MTKKALTYRFLSYLPFPVFGWIKSLTNYCWNHQVQYHCLWSDWKCQLMGTHIITINYLHHEVFLEDKGTARHPIAPGRATIVLSPSAFGALQRFGPSYHHVHWQMLRWSLFDVQLPSSDLSNQRLVRVFSKRLQSPLSQFLVQNSYILVWQENPWPLPSISMRLDVNIPSKSLPVSSAALSRHLPYVLRHVWCL